MSKQFDVGLVELHKELCNLGRRGLYIILTSSPFFTLLSFRSPPVKLRKAGGGESCLCPGPAEQLQSKPAKLTQSPRVSHTHYSNQSILDHPDTLDIWVSVSSLPSPSVSPPLPSFSIFLRTLHLSGTLVLTAASLRHWHSFLTVQLVFWHVFTSRQTLSTICPPDHYMLRVGGAHWVKFKQTLLIFHLSFAYRT